MKNNNHRNNDMKNNNHRNNDKMNMARRFTICCILLLSVAGLAMAQGQYVIKVSTQESGQTVIHYLSHAGNTLQDATTFSPDCLWTSDNTFTSGGTNKNYYYFDGTNYRFLAAPFVAEGAISLSDHLPSGTDLNNPESQYYFYRWDSGLGNGVQYFGVDSLTCEHEWHGGQCWEVYWVEYNTELATWKLSEESYEITPTGGHYYAVQIIEHPQDTTTLSGGLTDLTGFEMNFNESHSLSAQVSAYSYSFTPVYTEYQINEALYPNPDYYVTHNYWGGEDHGTDVPQSQTGSGNVSSYLWTISGEGMEHLSFDSGSDVNSSSATAPILYYRDENTTGDKTATLTLTVTYSDGSKQTTTATVTVKTRCQNPGQAATPVVTYTGVTVSWYPTADSYTVSWQKSGDTEWRSAAVGNVTSYIITGLDFGATYYYTVKADCDPDTSEPTPYSFTTKNEPAGLYAFGSVFGGGRMADVTGKTEVVIINCDSLSAVYGGNDIAGTVHDASGSKITLGVDADDPNDYDSYGTTGKSIKIGSVYGGGNGYYAYGSTTFAPVAADATTANVPAGAGVYALSPITGWNIPVWTNTSETPSTLTIPSITKTDITVTNNYVKVDSIFGGAKNAFLTQGTGANSSTITVNGGTIFAVFGGNNVGGSQGAGPHHIEVNKTTINLVDSIQNTATTGYGRDFGICYLFGGGNKVAASATEVWIAGGQCDTIFAGGNSADVAGANLVVNCPIAAGSGTTFGNVYSNAIASYAGGTITPKEDYGWNGFGGIYNVRTLFGGNNKAPMNIVPTVTLTSGSVGTVYGGGNAGDMAAHIEKTIHFDEGDLTDFTFKYGTYVQMNSPTMLVDYIYGGCQISNVLYSTWVELQKGHVGYVYGGCNISGDVGSTRVDPTAPAIPQTLEQQAVYGGTFVKAGGNSGDNINIYKNLYGGSNGYYHCSQDGIHYSAGINYADPEERYIGMTVPTHNETHAIICNGATIGGDVYAGGNLACVGFDDGTGTDRGYPELIGLASVRMDGGLVKGNVYGGGNMANIYGTNEVRVSGGTIETALYGGNDHSGQVAEKTNRILPPDYTTASDNETSLTALGVKTYVGIKGDAHIGTVYGGGNGDYAPGSVEYCYENFQPIQSYTFVDIHINGGASGGKIGTAYGGGNGVTARRGVTVFLNVKDPDYTHNNVDTIFGGNNKGDLDVVSDILLVHGQVGTVYGGCNRGAMAANGVNTKNIGGYDNIGSYVRLLDEYVPNGTGAPVTSTAKVSEAVYGGCRMNGVTKNSLVLVEGGDYTGVGLFGGSDISGHVGDTSRVVVVGGTVGDVYGGGNGNYDYDGHNVYVAGSAHIPADLVATSDVDFVAPTCQNSGADILGGYVGTSSVNGNVFGGGLGALTNTTNDVLVNVGRTTATGWTDVAEIYGNVYGGSALGSVNTNGGNSTTVNFLNGKLHGNLFGGGLGDENDATLGWVKGKVFVNIGDTTQTDATCYIDLREGNIYGCNNTNGSPQDDVTVHVWKTAFNFNDYPTGDNYTSQNGTNGTGAVYAINQVFGGGNKAHYLPENGTAGSGKKILVHVHDCLNTIKWVYAGGNAADATGVSAIIEGGRMDYVFGGGNGAGTGNPGANIGNGGTDTEVQGGIINHLFGGSNEKGDIAGRVITEINNNSGCTENIGEFYGGASLAALNPNGITTTIECGTGTFGTVYGGSKTADINGDVTLNIRGGTITNVFGGSRGTETDGADITGKVTLNLEGGVITNAFGGNNIKGLINDSIVVNVLDFGGDCGLQVDTIYGGGNLAAYAPTNPSVGPVVNVMHIAHADGVKGHVYGGGKKAQVTGNPIVNIGYDNTMSDYLSAISVPDTITLPSTSNFRAFVKGRVFGGGEEAGVAGTTTVNMNNGSVITGIYGGCYTSGTVTTDAVVNIYDGTIGTSSAKGYIFGGGYGEDTKVGTNVTVSFGDLGPTYANANPTLYGELYGGSALGTVNTNNSNTTTVYVLNGTIAGIPIVQTDTSYYDFGKVFGGGLGDKAALGEGHSDVAAVVNGRVLVQIGTYEDIQITDTYTGNATLINCDVFGCNNQNGSPQDEVEVHVYKTAHTPNNQANNPNGNYAIHEIFGGGNQADYLITGKKAVTWIHGCDNTIERLFGGGNAANVRGVELYIDGGRLGEVFGGGNGEVTAANVGVSGETDDAEVITVNIGGGLIGVLFLGSNMQGTVYGNINEKNYDGCEELSIIDHFMGANQTDIIGNITSVINCGPNFDPYDPDYDPESGDMPTGQSIEMIFVNLYCGSNRAQIKGDINLTIQGGIFENLFGGSKGRLDDPLTPDNNEYYKSDIDGNVTLIITGGTIGNLYGGCDLNGNITGKIGINIYEDSDATCPLFIGNIYGGGRLTNTKPTYDTIISPDIKILKGVIGGTTANLPILNATAPDTTYAGNVYGGGYQGNVKSNPRVIVGDGSDNKPVNILGNVYGGGFEGQVEGSSQVIIVPKTYTFTYDTPTDGNVIKVTNLLGNTVSSDTILGEGMDLLIEAIPSVYGQRFVKWTTSGADAGVGNATATSTTFTMGTENSNLTPVFGTATTHQLIITQPTDGGTFTVKDGQGNDVSSGSQISEGAVLKLAATPAAGNQLVEWEVTGGEVRSETSPHTIFTMGTGDATITASFQVAPLHTFEYEASPTVGGSITVTDASSNHVSSPAQIAEGSVLNLAATPAAGYRFVKWTIEYGNGIVREVNLPNTTFMMRTMDTKIIAEFAAEQP